MAAITRRRSPLKAARLDALTARPNAEVLLRDTVGLGLGRHVLGGFGLVNLAPQREDDVILGVPSAVAERDPVFVVEGLPDEDFAAGQGAASALPVPDA